MKSSYFIFLFYKFLPLVVGLFYAAIFAVEIGKRNTYGYDQKLVEFSALLFLVSFSVFYYIQGKLVRVILTDSQIIIKKKNLAIDWMKVEKITFTFIGLYKLTYERTDYYLIPQWFPRFIPLVDLSTDEFSEFIKEKKRMLKI